MLESSGRLAGCGRGKGDDEDEVERRVRERRQGIARSRRKVGRDQAGGVCVLRGKLLVLCGELAVCRLARAVAGGRREGGATRAVGEETVGLTSDVAAGTAAEHALGLAACGSGGHTKLVRVGDGAAGGNVEAGDEFGNVCAPRLEARAVLEDEDKALETLILHVDGEAELARDAGLGDLLDVADVDAALETEDALGLLHDGGIIAGV